MDRHFTLLLADDHTPQRRRLATRLAKDGYTVLQVATRDEARHQLATALPDALIVAGFEPSAAFIAEIRAGRVSADAGRVPIVVLSAEPRELALLQSFQAGADDFQPRWAPYPELRARIGAVLSRAHARDAASRIRKVGQLTVDLDAHAASWNGQRLSLANMEFELLAQLASAPTRVQSSETLLREVWGYRLPARTRTVEVHVRRLRRKLAAVGADDLIVTRHGLGYQLVATDSTDAEGQIEAARQ